MASISYKDLLKSIQTSTIMLADHIEDQPTIKVDWTSRLIQLPKEYQSFLAVQNDHQAETVYFCADRYFDGVDLSKMTCVIEYVNAKNEARVSPILDIDLTHDPSKIYFGWKLSRGATKEAGKIQFVLRLYSIDVNTDEYIYNISTQICQGTILRGVGKSTYPGQGNDDLTVDDAKALLDRITQLEQKAVSWVDL